MKLPKGKKENQEVVTVTEPEKLESLDISDLAGVGGVTEGKLKEAGCDTVEMLAVALVADLKELGIEETQARKIIDAARQHVKRVGVGFRTADELLKEHATLFHLKSRIPSFDEMLDGGLESRTVTIIHGKYAAGKSNFCHWLAACALTDPALSDSGIMYIDTENTFRPERLAQLLKTLGGDPATTLSRVIQAEAQNSAHQILIVDHAGKIIKDKNIRVLILDSLTAHFRSEYVGREMLARRQQSLNNHLQHISQLTRMFGLVTLVTTQEIDIPQQGYMGGTESRGAGGNVVFHRPVAIIQIWKPEGMNEKRFVTLEKHPALPQKKIILRLNEDGFSEFENPKE